jgi:hypothetical protein
MMHTGVDFSHLEFVEFMRAQGGEIERHKWIESEKANHDVGGQAALQWIRDHASQFRESYIRKLKGMAQL